MLYGNYIYFFLCLNTFWESSAILVLFYMVQVCNRRESKQGVLRNLLKDLRQIGAIHSLKNDLKANSFLRDKGILANPFFRKRLAQKWRWR